MSDFVEKSRKLTHSFFDYMCNLHHDTKCTARMIRTGIVCSIGPSSSSVLVLEKMIEAGMTIARLKAQRTDRQMQHELICRIRQAALNYSHKTNCFRPVAIALDTHGPALETGSVTGDSGDQASIELLTGATVRLTSNKAFENSCNEEYIYVNYPKLASSVSIGRLVMLDHGAITLVVKEVREENVLCEVEVGGSLSSRRRVNIQNSFVDLPDVSQEDIDDIKFGIEQGVDIIFLSVVREAETIRKTREALGAQGKDIKLIAKICEPQGLRNMNDIIHAADGVLIARGNLSSEIPPEKMFIVQKTLIARCNVAGKPVICTMEMMKSMVDRPRVTCAEVNDVANAVLDGADCVMLTSETARGKYPVDAVKMMAAICKEAEHTYWNERVFDELVQEVRVDPIDYPQEMAISCVQSAQMSSSAAIIVMSMTGRLAYLISKYRPRCPIIMITREPKVARQANLFSGIRAFIYPDIALPKFDEDLAKRIQFAFKMGLKAKLFNKGDNVIFSYGWHSSSGYTTAMRAARVGSTGILESGGGDGGKGFTRCDSDDKEINFVKSLMWLAF